LQTLSGKQFPKKLVDEFIRFVRENKDMAAIIAIYISGLVVDYYFK
jgi:hypothetical protein